MRLKKYLDVESEVLYPPCDTEGFEWMGDGDYFLSTARLEPLKRVDLIVEAFKDMPNKKLIVASGGSQLESLEELADGAKNITFTGWVSDTELRRLVGNCTATIYIPKDEDFGISPVQSLAAGKPVIGVNEGGVVETVRETADGVLISTPPSAAKIRDAVSRHEQLNRSAFHPNAARLQFRQAFMDRLTESLG
jgi:glycosyltransferase involved in cell wall biosynthesis